jgi:tetratricopeptide (TPR) repeat protein
MVKLSITDMKKAILIITTVLFALSGYSQEKNNPGLDEMWSSGNENYSKGHFEEALSDYMRIAQLGYLSEPLMYNIANCHFKMKRWGKSILYYERALKINPGNRDVQNNLKLAREFTVDKIEELPEFILNTWVRNINYLLSSDGWSYLSLLFFSVTILLLLNFRYGPSSGIRKLSFFLSMTSLLTAIIFTIFAWNQKHSYHKRDSGIVMMPVSTVRSSPDASGNTLFILHEGTKIELIDKLGNWRRIELADGRQGWIADGDLEVI